MEVPSESGAFLGRCLSHREPLWAQEPERMAGSQTLACTWEIFWHSESQGWMGFGLNSSRQHLALLPEQPGMAGRGNPSPGV